ncbi:MAG: hypothetical protein IPJ49_14845 [Candidatus Obscuribacter sp.]|nr:hypothetical protein [Candidatus Obscuribacter sp.]
MDIAHKAHEHSVSEVAHVAMQKAYSLVSNVPDALLFAREAHSIGLDDLSRNALKDLIEGSALYRGADFAFAQICWL